MSEKVAMQVRQDQNDLVLSSLPDNSCSLNICSPFVDLKQLWTVMTLSVSTCSTIDFAVLVCRTMQTSSLHELPAELSTYISQMKYYERMHKVKEREQHIQEVNAHAQSSMIAEHGVSVYAIHMACMPVFVYCWTANGFGSVMPLLCRC